MNKKYIVSSIVITAIGIAGLAFAQTTDTTTGATTPTVTSTGQPLTPRPLPVQNREDAAGAKSEIKKDFRETKREVKKDLREVRANATSTEAREAAREKMEESRKKLEEKREEAHKKAGLERAKAIIKRLDRQVADMNRLANRIAGRLSLYRSQGADTTAIDTALADARTKIAIAKTKVSTIITAIEGLLATPSTTATSTNVNDALKVIAPQVREAEAAIRDADKALRATLKTRFVRPKPSETGTAPVADTTTTGTTTQ